METVTTCTLDCPDRCSIRCELRRGSVRIRGNPDHPHTRGFTCDKIRRHPERLRSPHRIREPWLREDGRFRPASWEEAMERVCASLAGALTADPASVLLVRGAGSMGVSKTFADYVFGGFGARSTRGSYCDSAGTAAVAADAGQLEMNDPAEIDRAEAIVLWGKHPAASSIHTAAQVVRARKRDVPVLAVNPDPKGVENLADRVLTIRPGTDRFLALACAKILLDRPEASPPWNRAANPDAFRSLLARHRLGDLLETCGVAATDAERLAEVYGRTPRVATLVGWGVQRYERGGETVRALHALAFLAGTLGIPGGGFYYNISSSRPFSVPAPTGDPAPPLLLPALGRELRDAEPPIRFAWITNSNTINQGPDAKALREALEDVPDVVTVDGFWTETARHSSVVLPPALWLEEEDVVGSAWHDTVALARPVVEPPEGCHTDFEILREVTRRLGRETPFASAEQWLAACLPKGGPDLAELRERGWARGPRPTVAWRRGFAHADGKFRLVEEIHPEPAVDPRHPLRLLTLVRTEAIHSQMLPEEQEGPLPVRVHPHTAARHGLASGSPVRVTSRVGELEGSVHLDARLHPDCVACPRGGWINLGLGVNEATEVRVTDLGEGTAYYDTRVRVEPVAGSVPR